MNWIFSKYCSHYLIISPFLWFYFGIGYDWKFLRTFMISTIDQWSVSKAIFSYKNYIYYANSFYLPTTIWKYIYSICYCLYSTYNATINNNCVVFIVISVIKIFNLLLISLLWWYFTSTNLFFCSITSSNKEFKKTLSIINEKQINTFKKSM